MITSKKIIKLGGENYLKVEEKQITNQNNLNDYNKKNEFLNRIKVQVDSRSIYLKNKLDRGEIKAIDLTDEQIDELQKMYDKEITEKKRKIKRLKGLE